MHILQSTFRTKLTNLMGIFFVLEQLFPCKIPSYPRKSTGKGHMSMIDPSSGTIERELEFRHLKENTAFFRGFRTALLNHEL